jgi:dephospho-CoA kinase|tara:strand:- start:3456 stop:4013 length:558 start_codon:yes stop_codon:yes gene_type:complete
MIKIAITGKIGSGKSTALDYFKKLGHFTLSSDQLIKEIYNDDSLRKILLKNLGVPNKEYKKEIIKKMQDKAFNYKLKKNLYPLMNRLRIKRMPSFISKRNNFFEIPLLFEEKLDRDYDIIIFIKSDYNVRRKRILKKGMTEKYFETMNGYQDAEGPKENHSHITILNNGSTMNFHEKLNHYEKNL